MAFYESVFIARQDISSTQVDALTDAFTEILTQNGGKLANKEYWGLKNLTYRIKKNRKGHYMLLSIDAPAAAVNEMERNMRLNEDVLRYLTVRVEALEEGPSVMMQSKGDRSDRPRRWGDREDGPRRDDGFRRGPRREGGPGAPAQTEGADA
ncbi:MAG: 30S ribosomal protein S6 [Alphaproteobacteria bacterium]|nr:30S ribosomal protein S6 [Alphaproteobacteria bacterium]